jgi:hypothetical protein
MITKYVYLAPGGFSMPYTLGICKFIKENYHPIISTEYKFIGSSAGSWLAVYLASDMYINDLLLMDYKKKFEKKSIIYKWHNICPFLTEQYKQNIKNVDFINEKKVKISVSEYNRKKKRFQNNLIDDYNSLDELLTLCSHSSYIPVLSGINIPRRNNIITFDGFFTNPDFEHRRINLCIYNGMFNRKFTFSDVIGKNSIFKINNKEFDNKNFDNKEINKFEKYNAIEYKKLMKLNTINLLNLGYYDAMINKDKLDLLLI